MTPLELAEQEAKKKGFRDGPALVHFLLQGFSMGVGRAFRVLNPDGQWTQIAPGENVLKAEEPVETPEPVASGEEVPAPPLE